ncbi:hypothetical protein DER46DRAFT_165636 [Fusarium sp. MPI-SDFR-AT-0072]|nr:hypothetical protein DER46DRAFT_165636 [Fusarium sp. MPI-SDFR-AT-0072]
METYIDAEGLMTVLTRCPNLTGIAIRLPDEYRKLLDQYETEDSENADCIINLDDFGDVLRKFGQNLEEVDFNTFLYDSYSADYLCRSPIGSNLNVSCITRTFTNCFSTVCLISARFGWRDTMIGMSLIIVNQRSWITFGVNIAIRRRPSGQLSCMSMAGMWTSSRRAFMRYVEGQRVTATLSLCQGRYERTLLRFSSIHIKDGTLG